MTTTAVVLTHHGTEGIVDAMTVMAGAFEPRYGEAWTASQCEGVLAMPGATLVIARAPTPVGFALVRTIASEAELMLIGVLPLLQGRGIGARLLDATLAVARTAGCEHYFLEVRDDNAAIALYRQYGLEQVGIRRNYYRGVDGKRRDGLTFRKSFIQSE